MGAPALKSSILKFRGSVSETTSEMANMGQPVVTVAQDFAFLRALIDLTKTRSTVPSEIEAQYRRYYNERIGALTNFAMDSYVDETENDAACIEKAKAVLENNKTGSTELQPTKADCLLSNARRDCEELIRAAQFAKFIDNLKAAE